MPKTGISESLAKIRFFGYHAFKKSLIRSSKIHVFEVITLETPLQIHTQAAPRVDGARRRDGNLRPSGRTRPVEPDAAIFGDFAFGLACHHCIRLVHFGYRQYAQFPLRIPFPVFPVAGKSRFPPSQVSCREL